MNNKKHKANIDDNGSLKKQLVSAVNFKKKREKIKKRGQKGGVVGALSAFGAMGWNITIPVLLMLLLGKFLIEKLDLKEEAILNFLFVGFLVGAYNAFKEIRKEYRKGVKITQDKKEEEKDL